MTRHRFSILTVCALLTVAIVAIASRDAVAVVGEVYQETFDFDTADALADYPEFSIPDAADSASVVGGQLRLSGTNCQFYRPGFAMPHTVSGLLTTTSGGGHIGMYIGGNEVIFHPGYPGVAYRVHGTGGFGNRFTDFTAAQNTLHKLEVTSDGRGNFEFTLTDGDNPANTVTDSYTNPSAVGGPIGFKTAGGDVSRLDDLTVTVPNLRYAETFNNDFSLGSDVSSNGGDMSSIGGRLHLQGSAGRQSLTWDTPTGGFTFRGEMTTDVGDGSYHVGLILGNNSGDENRVLFHPGYPGGALRGEGPGGFSNKDVGFTPANNVLHELEVTADGTGNFDIKLTDGDNPANVYTTSFTNPSYSPGALSFFRVGTDAQNRRTAFDNMAIEPAANAPINEDFNNQFATKLNGGSVGVVDGVLQLGGAAGNSDQFWSIGNLSFGDELIVSAEIGADATATDFSVGLKIGENLIGFRPGVAGGDLYASGPGGFSAVDVGFTPTVDTLYLLQVYADADVPGLFDVTLVDRNDPANNVFTASFTNPNGPLGGEIALFRSGSDAGTGLYDNLVVQQIPEPATLTLLALGTLMGFALSRKRPHQQATRR